MSKQLKILSLFALILAFSITKPLMAEGSDSLSSDWVTANQAYDQGRFEEAVRLYEKIATNLAKSDSANGHVFYNLSNAYFRTGKLGSAMAALLAARRFLPRDPDVAANLKFLYSQTTDRLDIAKAKSIWMIIFGFLALKATPRELAYLMTFMFSVAFLLLTSSLLFRKLRLLRFPSIAILALALFIGLNFGWSLDLDETWSAVTQPSLKVFSGPSEKDTVLFELHEGAPFILREARDKWAKVELSDGKRGWILLAQAKVF